MQSALHAGLPEKSQYTLADMEIIRAKHHESSEKMILESVQQTKKISLGLEQCKDYASFIAILAKSHCGKVKINNIRDSSLIGEGIRLKLLTALLKLADELDRDYRRVNIQDLKLWGIPVESKFYWWTHHYTQSIGIKNGRIKLYFRFPEEYRGNDIEEVFIKKTEESIRGQLEEVYDILWDKGVKLTLDTKIEKTYVPEGIVEVIPDDLFDYIENILKMEKIARETSIRTGAAWYVDGIPYSDNIEIIECFGKISKYLQEGNYLKAIEEVEKGLILTMAPMKRLAFLLIAGNCYYTLGVRAETMDWLREAENRYTEALKISEREKVKEIYKEDAIKGRATVLGNIGFIYKTKGDLENAQKYYEEALKICREIGDKEGEATQLGNIGTIYLAKGDYKNVLNYSSEALKIDREIGNKQGEAGDLGFIGIIYSVKGESKNALKCHEETLKIHREIGDKQGEADDLIFIEPIYKAKGNLEKAQKCHEERLKIERELYAR
jgi:tetratricopeptide (TPR) repeat protein